jgi:hypothetical protein
MGTERSRGGAPVDDQVFDDLGSEDLDGAPASARGPQQGSSPLGAVMNFFGRVGRAVFGTASPPLSAVAKGKTLDSPEAPAKGQPGYQRYRRAMNRT